MCWGGVCFESEVEQILDHIDDDPQPHATSSNSSDRVEQGPNAFSCNYGAHSSGQTFGSHGFLFCSNRGISCLTPIPDIYPYGLHSSKKLFSFKFDNVDSTALLRPDIPDGGVMHLRLNGTLPRLLLSHWRLAAGNVLTSLEQTFFRELPKGTAPQRCNTSRYLRKLRKQYTIKHNAGASAKHSQMEDVKLFLLAIFNCDLHVYADIWKSKLLLKKLKASSSQMETDSLIRHL